LPMISSRPNHEWERWTRVDGSCYRYLSTGSGDPVVFISGLLGFSFSWRYNLGPLSRAGSLYAVDLLGAGYSDHPLDIDCGLRAQGERVLRFLEVQGIRRVVLAGNSHGAAVAMMTAALAAGNGGPMIEKLIFTGPVHPWATFKPLQSLLIDSY